MARRRRQLRPSGACLWVALGTLLLGGAGEGLAQNRGGQAPASAQQLVERLRQIQGELSQGQAAAEETAGGAPTEQELRGQVRRIEGEIGAATEAPQPAARLSADQVRQQIADDLGVQVLHVERVATGGRPIYALRVMNPPGNYNAAFRVVTLLVDGDTGELLGEAQATPDVDNPDAFPALRDTGDRDSGLELRRRTWR